MALRGLNLLTFVSSVDLTRSLENIIFEIVLKRKGVWRGSAEEIESLRHGKDFWFATAISLGPAPDMTPALASLIIANVLLTAPSFIWKFLR